MISRIILGVDQAFIWTEVTVCAKISFPPPISFAFFLVFVLNIYILFILAIVQANAIVYAKNIHFPAPISFASFLVIVLINSYFLKLATVQADANVCAKIFIFAHEFLLAPLNLLF